MTDRPDGLGVAANAPADANGPGMFGFANPTGIVRNDNVNAAVDFYNPLFQSLGTNGCLCGSHLSRPTAGRSFRRTSRGPSSTSRQPPDASS